MYKYINYFRVQENRYCVSSSPIFPFLFLSSYFSHFFLFSYFSHFSFFPPSSIFHGSFLCAEESPVLVSTGNINFPRRGRSPSALWTLVNNSRQIQFPFSDTRTRFKSCAADTILRFVVETFIIRPNDSSNACFRRHEWSKIANFNLPHG